MGAPTSGAAHPAERRGGARRSLVLLVVGAGAGLTLAASGLLRTAESGTGPLPPGVVARVNGTAILREDYERLVAGVESDTRREADAATRRLVLDRMIEEELLVQRGLELGLATRDRRIRAELTTAVIRAVVKQADAREPTREELERFYREQRAFFTRPGRLRVRQVFFRAAADAADASVRASEARARLRAGEPLERVRADLGDPEVSPLPDALLPATKLREYLGPTATRAALELPVGTPSEPIRSGSGHHVLLVVEREENRIPDLGDIESQVRAEWRRRAGDRALRSYLDELRARAEVEVAAAAP